MFRVLGKYRTYVLLRVSYFGEVLHKCAITCFVFGEVSHKCVITCFVFWGSIAQMCYHVFRVWGKYRTNVLLCVLYFGEVTHKCAITCFVFCGSIAQMQKIFHVPRSNDKNVRCVYWYSTAQMWHIASAPAKLKYSTCLVFLGCIANI